MPHHMKALVFRGDNDLRYEDWPVPRVGPAEALVRVGAVGICGSDVHGYLGRTGRRTAPMIMGHEFAGTVERVGKRVRGPRPGQRVAVFPYASCGTCACCREGATAACPDKRMFGVFDVSGGMAEYVSVPANQVIPLPEGASLLQAPLAEPLSVAVHGVEKAGLRRDTRLAIVGAGAIGLMCLVLARQHGVKSVTVLDIAPDRLKLAKRLGAEGVIRGNHGAVPSGGFDVVVEAVGAAAALNQAVRLAARGGQVIVLGMSQREIPVDMFDIVAREIRLEGSFNYNFEEFERIVGLLPSLRTHLDPVISHVVPLERGVDMFRRIAQGETGMCKVILTGNAGSGEGQSVDRERA
jgi:2-desacetyl-2-hydroxyethyl bacteriochlorophyllide A dehydrogenase